MTAAITCSPFTPAERPATEYYYFSHSFCDLTAVSQLLCSCICIFLRQGCRASDHIVCYIGCNPNHRIKIQFIRMFLRNTLDYFALHCFRDVPKAYLGPASCADVYELVVGLVNLSLVSVFTVQHLLPSCVSGHVSHDLIHCSTSLKFPMLFLCMMCVHQSKTFFDAVVRGIFRHCLTFLTFLFKKKTKCEDARYIRVTLDAAPSPTFMWSKQEGKHKMHHFLCSRNQPDKELPKTKPKPLPPHFHPLVHDIK